MGVLARWWDPEELAVWWRIAWPTALTYAGRVAMMVTDLAVVGHLGTTELAAASMVQ